VKSSWAIIHIKYEVKTNILETCPGPTRVNISIDPDAGLGNIDFLTQQ
jgi:hypothetical protein